MLPCVSSALVHDLGQLFRAIFNRAGVIMARCCHGLGRAICRHIIRKLKALGTASFPPRGELNTSNIFIITYYIYIYTHTHINTVYIIYQKPSMTIHSNQTTSTLTHCFQLKGLRDAPRVVSYKWQPQNACKIWNRDLPKLKRIS